MQHKLTKFPGHRQMLRAVSNTHATTRTTTGGHAYASADSTSDSAANSAADGVLLRCYTIPALG